MPLSIFQKRSPHASSPALSVQTTPKITSALVPSPSVAAAATFESDIAASSLVSYAARYTASSNNVSTPIGSSASSFRDNSHSFSPTESTPVGHSNFSRVGSISSRKSHKLPLTNRHELKSKSSSQSLKSKLSRKLTSASSKSTSSQQHSLPPIIPELPPLEVPEHYEDLTNLFTHKKMVDLQTASTSKVLIDLNSSATQTNVAEYNVPEPILHLKSNSDHNDLYDFEFYDLDQIKNQPNDIKVDTQLSIVPPPQNNENLKENSNNNSPVPTTPASQQSNTFIDTAATSPVSIQKPRLSLQTHASFSSKVRNIFTKRQTPTTPVVESQTLVQPDDKPETHPTQDFSLPFTTSKIVPHFTEINNGPTYKAQVTRSTNTIPQSTIRNDKISLDPSSASHLVNNTSEDSELLDFVPNLRPAISSMGSRFRTSGPTTPASIVMTKSQYDKYLQDKKKDSNSLSVTNKEEENDDDDNETGDEDSDDEYFSSRHHFENEENRRQDMRMRMRQDAHLSVYRQKMTKLTGSQIGLLDIKSESKNHVKNNENESDEDEIPLAILQAQGFSRRPHSGSPTNLSDNDPGEITYSKRNKSSCDVNSLYTPPSTGPSTPAVEEGYLAMRNKSSVNLPGFNSTVPMNRGLVGEISKEETAKLKRRSIMNTLVVQPKETDGNVVFGNKNESQNEINTQIQQMMSMQNKILTQMANQNSVTAVNSTPTMTGGFQRYSNWSSFDVMTSHQRPISRYNAAPSVMSFSNSFGNQPSTSVREEDEEEEEAEWKKMDKKREQMREMWKSHQVLVS